MNKLAFINEEYSQYLYEEGLVFFPLLEPEDINSLKSLFNKYHPTKPDGFYASTHIEDKALRKEISDHIYSIIAPRLEGRFENIQVLGGAFISKAPGEKGILPLHQDWNIVDEEKARSYNLWIPLCDVSEHNGAMRILARSHRKEKTFRGPNIPPTLYPISSQVDRHMYTLNMKAGEALIYDHALWHSSPQNQSDSLRLAIVMGVIPAEAEMKYYYKNGNAIEEYRSYPDFFFENDRENGHQNLDLIRSIPFEVKSLTEKEFREVYLGEIPEKVEGKTDHSNETWLDRLLKFFKLKAER